MKLLREGATTASDCGRSLMLKPHRCAIGNLGPHSSCQGDLMGCGRPERVSNSCDLLHEFADPNRKNLFRSDRTVILSGYFAAIFDCAL